MRFLIKLLIGLFWMLLLLFNQKLEFMPREKKLLFKLKSQHQLQFKPQWLQLKKNPPKLLFKFLLLLQHLSRHQLK
jgi:hypothetical protein